MMFQHAEERRQWCLTALDRLQDFVEHDPDFHGNRTYEAHALGLQREFVEQGQYRVVFLGAFNVGKSTAINAFLGGAFLPMDVEECTSRLTFIRRGDHTYLELRFERSLEDHELGSLRSICDKVAASVSPTESPTLLQIHFPEARPATVSAVLSALITVNADEQFPALATLRQSLRELHIVLPAEFLSEDIVFVDTPGVHSISDTRAEIAYGMIERCNLVVVFVDSDLAGNVHDLNFIKRTIKWRGRQVFFVLNKADKLEPEELDVRGQRGPLRTLRQAFQRHGIPEDSEVFFLSGYRALRAQQIQRGELSLSEVLEDNRLQLPLNLVEHLESCPEGLNEIAHFLMTQSRFPVLKQRLLEFLAAENRSAAIVEAVLRFLAERADSYVVSLENELSLAKDPTQFEVLRQQRQDLEKRLEAVRWEADRLLNVFNARSKGGRVGDTTFPGYEKLFRLKLTPGAVQDRVIQPILEWLREGDHLREARRSAFKSLTAQVEHQLDEFISSVLAEITAEIEVAEKETRAAIAEKLGQVRGLRLQLSGTAPPALGDVKVAVTGSYLAFGAGGAALGAAAGAVVGSVVPVFGTILVAGIGALVGAVSGLVTRFLWSSERWIQMLTPVITEQVNQILFHGVQLADGTRSQPVVESVCEHLRRRADAFYEALREEVDAAVASVKEEIDSLLAREEEIRRERDSIIVRLEPKVQLLQDIRRRSIEYMQPISAPRD